MAFDLKSSSDIKAELNDIVMGDIMIIFCTEDFFVILSGPKLEVGIY